MSKPCEHPNAHREPGCRVCELYATNRRYRDLWDGLVSLTPAPCVHLGLPARVHGSNRDWRTCGNPTAPLGNPVCQCRGCGPKCVGYEAG
jgi:hypothetical protein